MRRLEVAAAQGEADLRRVSNQDPLSLRRQALPCVAASLLAYFPTPNAQRRTPSSACCLLRSQGQRPDAAAGGSEDGVADRRGDGNDRRFAGAGGGEVLPVEQD